jgi:hypothetical protein
MAGRPELHDRQARHGVEEKPWPAASWSRTLLAGDLRLPARQQLRAVGTAGPALRLLTDGDPGSDASCPHEDRREAVGDIGHATAD